MKAYKLTDENMETEGGMKWGEGVTHEATGEGEGLCSDGWIHFYTDLLVGVFMNPAHANFENPIAWECVVGVEELHEPLKSGCKRLTTIKQVPLPEITITQRVAFGILCTLAVCKDKLFVKWAASWLDGTNRTKESARATAFAFAFGSAASHAAYAASHAAYAAAYAAYAANASAAANANAAYAAYAAASAAKHNQHIDFSAIAKKALQYT